MEPEQFGKLLATRRKELGMTQARLGEKLHLTAKTISKWECGHGFPDISSIIPLAEALEISIAQLMMVEEQSEKEELQNEIIQESIKNTVSLAENEVTKKTKKRSISVISIIVLLVIEGIGIFIPSQEHIIKSFSGSFYDNQRTVSPIEMTIDMKMKHYLFRKDTVSGSLRIFFDDNDTCIEAHFENHFASITNLMG